MEREQLKNTLRELHEELASGDDIDPETAALIRQLSTDIDRLSAKPVDEEVAGIETIDLNEQQTVLDRLLDLSEGFEESHPKLAHAIGNVATALSRIGI